VSAAQSDIDGGSLRCFAAAVGVGACVVIAFATIWFLLGHSTLRTFDSAEIGPDRDCPPANGASWSASGKSGNVWAITTNLLACEDVGKRVGKLAGKSILALANEADFRCTAKTIVDDVVLSGICYSTDSSGYFAWGADVAPYDHPTPCERCTGIPGEHFSPLVGKSPAP
jgi:hypothetical protein